MRGSAVFAIAALLLLPGCLREDMTTTVFNDTTEPQSVALTILFGPKEEALANHEWQLEPGGSASTKDVGRGAAGTGTLVVRLSLGNGTVAEDRREDWKAGEGPNWAVVHLETAAVRIQFGFAD